MVEIFPLRTLAEHQIEVILDAAFGTDRHLRTAYRLRSGMAAIPGLSFAASVNGVAAGTVQCWPVAHFADDAAGDPARDGAVTPLVMVGPVAVLPEHQQQGLGRRLMDAVMAVAPAVADGALMMIGDPEYYGRFFGFSADATGAWRLPGPFDRHRLLASGIGDRAIPATTGAIGPRPATMLASARGGPTFADDD